MPIHKSLEIWTAQTLCNIGILFSVLSFLLYVARPYFDKMLLRFNLKVTSSLWWFLYISLRDGSLLVAVLLGFIHLNLDIMSDIKIGLPFVPLGTVALTAALAVKVVSKREEVSSGLSWSFGLVALGAILNAIGYVFVMEAPGVEYRIAESWFWRWIVSLRSNRNPELSAISFFVSFALLVLIIAILTLRFFFLYKPTAGKKGDSFE